MSDMGAMQKSNEKPTQGMANGHGHSLMAVDRREITVKGVSEVLSFDESIVRLVTVCGILNLEGEGLRVHVLDLTSGVVAVTGRLCGVLYEEDASVDTGTAPRGRTRARRLFR